jgi:hypothetical protein
MSDTTTAEEFEGALVEVLQDDADRWGVLDLRTFADAGVLTQNAGLVVRLDDGSEFQVTVVKSR